MDVPTFLFNPSCDRERVYDSDLGLEKLGQGRFISNCSCHL